MSKAEENIRRAERCLNAGYNEQGDAIAWALLALVETLKEIHE